MTTLRILPWNGSETHFWWSFKVGYPKNVLLKHLRYSFTGDWVMVSCRQVWYFTVVNCRRTRRSVREVTTLFLEHGSLSMQYRGKKTCCLFFFGSAFSLCFPLSCDFHVGLSENRAPLSPVVNHHLIICPSYEKNLKESYCLGIELTFQTGHVEFPLRWPCQSCRCGWCCWVRWMQKWNLLTRSWAQHHLNREKSLTLRPTKVPDLIIFVSFNLTHRSS